MGSVVGHLAQRYGLYDAYLAYAGGQFLQSFLVELAPGLVGVGFYVAQLYFV